jgi:hypothetical protein
MAGQSNIAPGFSAKAEAKVSVVKMGILAGLFRAPKQGNWVKFR